MEKHKINSLQVFLISFISMLLIMLPITIYSKGYFIYSGDYNYQHMIFTPHVYDMIRSGKFGIDMMNSLGVDVLESYGHIIFTPFFVLSLIIPTKDLYIYFLPVFTALKVAVAAWTAYIYIKRYVNNYVSAAVGAFLYAFSGYQSFSFIFGSFNDITAWFPLMLFFMDEYFYNDRKSIFTIIVAYMAALNSFFFYGQVMFIVLYFIIKVLTKEYNLTCKKFICLSIEAVSGVLISGILLYPGVKGLMGNSRVSSFINGIDMVSYSDRSIFWRTLQSICMMPDIAGKTSLFPGQNTWASLSYYLPCTGIVFVVAYIRHNLKKWDSLIICSSLVMSLIPVLNSIFFMFNSEYYARWVYMPVLIMSMVTSKELDQFKAERIQFGVKFSAIYIILFALIAFLPAEVNEVDENLKGKIRVRFAAFPVDSIVFWKYLGLASLFVLLIYFLITKYNSYKIFVSRLIPVIVMGTIVVNIAYFNDVNNIDTDEPEKFITGNLIGPELPKNDGEFYRVSSFDSNANLIWDEVASINNFITNVPSSENDFYKAFDISRTQYTWIDSRYYPIYSLLSCKYYLNSSTYDELNVEYHPFKLDNFKKIDVQPCYHIYENKAYISPGFMYDYYITESELERFTENYSKLHPQNITEEFSESNSDENVMDKALKRMVSEPDFRYDEKYLKKMLALFRAMVVSDEDECKVNYYLPPIPIEMLDDIGDNTYYSDCIERNAESCYWFECTKSGFEAKIKSETSNYVFFSVPYMYGWSAQVNGKDTEIVKVNYGFMAVKVDEGDNDIVFSYINPNYRTGAFISLAGLILYIIYSLYNYFINKSSNIVKLNRKTRTQENV